MRFVATLLLWILTTAALAVAVPASWAQHNVVDRNGYSALATSAAKDPRVQQAMSDELTTQLVNLAANSGYDVNENLLAGAARAYTSGSAFPGQFALANQLVHRWLFTDIVSQSDASGRWEIDLSPMLSDSSFQQTLADFGIKAPSSLTIPLTKNVSDSVRPGQLRDVAKWGPWASVGAVILTGVLALLTLAAARQRGKALAALGVSGLIVGAAGWAAIEVGRRRVNDALDATSGEIRNLAAAMVEHAIGSLHLWLNLTMAAGAALVVLGVLASMLGGLRKRTVREPAR
ncbi:MAG: hypothetical protein ACRDUX_31935 [Mycobacterium sp.]